MRARVCVRRYFVGWSRTEGAFCENWNNGGNLLGVFNTSDECREFCAPSGDCSVCTFFCRTDQVGGWRWVGGWVVGGAPPWQQQ